MDIPLYIKMTMYHLRKSNKINPVQRESNGTSTKALKGENLIAVTLFILVVKSLSS